MNNVALFTALPEGPFDEFTEENWDRCMEVNLKGFGIASALFSSA